MAYFVYVILCDDGSYYTGYTKNLQYRFKQHINGLGARYTKMHKPKKLVYSEKFGTLTEAVRRERAIKLLTHKEKTKLTGSSLVC